jgi:hypothetical protein
MKHRGKTVRYCLHEKITDLVHVSVIATNKAYPNNIHKHPHKIETIYALKGNANLCLYVNDQNDKEIQNYKSSACGYYCIAFIKFLHNKTNKEKSFLTFLKLFNIKTHHNDKILHELLY